MLSVKEKEAEDMSVGRGPWPPWIFMLGTYKVEGGLMVLFSALFFPLPLSP